MDGTGRDKCEPLVSILNCKVLDMVAASNGTRKSLWLGCRGQQDSTAKNFGLGKGFGSLWWAVRLTEQCGKRKPC